MTTVQNRVNTTFTANVGGAVSAMSMLGGVGSVAGGAISALTSMFSPLNAALGAITVGGAIAGITQLGSSFEMTRNMLAGALGALGVAGGADPTERFRNGLLLAASTMEQIEASAARLPGEAEDYIQVFRTSLPVIQASLGGTLQEMTAFSNQYTAIGRTFGIDAMQIGMDLTRMLRAGRGGAGADVRTFQSLVPFLRTIQGQAGLTAESFNRMTAADRVHLLQRAFAGLQPMLDASATSFESMQGAIMSTARTLGRRISAPLFDGIKNAMASFNAMFMDSEGNLTAFADRIVLIGSNISRYIVSGFESAFAMVQRMRVALDRMSESPLFKALQGATGRLVGAATRLFSAQAPAGVAGGRGASLGGTAQRTVATVEHVGVQLAGMLNTLSGVVGAAVNPFLRLSDMISSAAGVILPAFVGMVQAILGPLTTFWSGLLGVADFLMQTLAPVFNSMFNAVSNLLIGIGDFLNPVIRILGRVIGWVVDLLARFLAPYIEAVVGVFAMLINKIGEFLSWLGGIIGQAADSIAPPAPAEMGGGSGFLSGILDALTQGNDADQRDRAAEAAAGAAARATPNVRGGARTTQDFRFSRFDITQRFAEGFDPDRIAVAFADDLGRVGSERLQSGLEPVFGIR